MSGYDQKNQKVNTQYNIYINNVRQEIQDTIKNEKNELKVEVLRKIKTLPIDFEILNILNEISIQFPRLGGSEYDDIERYLNIGRSINKVPAQDICTSLDFLKCVNLIESVEQLSRQIFKITQNGKNCLIINR